MSKRDMMREKPSAEHMAHHPKGGHGPGSVNSDDGTRAIKQTMEDRKEPMPERINPAPTMERTLGPGSRC